MGIEDFLEKEKTTVPDQENIGNKSSLQEQYEKPEILELSGGNVELIDINPDEQKTKVPVVVMPGWSATPEVFKDNIITFAEQGRRTISVDSPDGIKAEKKDHLPEAELRKVAALIETLEEKNIDKVDAVAHSEAGIALAIAATLYPEKFRNLILVDPGGMMGQDRADKLAGRFSMDILKQTIDAMKDFKRLKPIGRSFKEGIKSFVSNPSQSIKEVMAISDTQIHEMLKDLKQKGIGISIIHGVDDKAFPMDRVQQMAKSDQLDGFYSVRGTHNEFYLNAVKYTKLADAALDALEAKHKN